MRPIDADALFDFLTEQIDKETGAYSKGRNAGLNIARSALHDKTITPTIAPPPNDPLTLEELREMDGEPVWIETTDIKKANRWAFVDVGSEVVRFFETRCGVKCPVMGNLFRTYGKTWLAYRRKPEEETI